MRYLLHQPFSLGNHVKMTSTTETIANLEGPNDLLESEIPTTWSPELTSIIMQSLLGTINSTMNSLNSSLTNSLNTTASPYELLEDLQETTEAFANLNGTLREEEFKEWQKTSKCISSHTYALYLKILTFVVTSRILWEPLVIRFYPLEFFSNSW